MRGNKGPRERGCVAAIMGAKHEKPVCRRCFLVVLTGVPVQWFAAVCLLRYSGCLENCWVRLCETRGASQWWHPATRGQCQGWEIQEICAALWNATWSQNQVWCRLWGAESMSSDIFRDPLIALFGHAACQNDKHVTFLMFNAKS